MAGSKIKSSQPRENLLDGPTTLAPRNGGEFLRIRKDGLDGTSTSRVIKSSSKTALGPKQNGL